MPLTRRHLLASIPVIGATALGLGFSSMLGRMKNGAFDPHAVNSPLLGKNVPDFVPLPALSVFGDSRDTELLTPDLLRKQTRPVLLNFMASWCIPCIMELPFLEELAQNRDQDIAIWGIAYKDKSRRVMDFLRRNGQPYARLGNDESGRCAIEWGVSGVPESFLVLPGGQIIWHGATALGHQIYEAEIRPRLPADSRPVAPG